MNELSWMIYAADVAGRLGWLFGLTGFFGVAAGIGFIIANLASLWDAEEYDTSAYRREGRSADPDPDYIAYRDRSRKDASLFRKLSVRFLVPCTVALVIGSVIPSRDTLYAIAASEFGEDILNSETGGKAINALNAWLDRQIAPKTEATQ